MVTRTILATAALLLTVSRAAAAPPDWRAAGGALFAGSTSAAAAEPEPLGARLPPLSQPYATAVGEAAQRHGLDPKLLHALVTVESAYRADAVSPAGAAGLTQLMPGTAAALNVHDRFDAPANLEGGADYLARLLLRFGDLRLALAAYNDGPDRVAQLGRTPDLPETRVFVTRVINCYLALSAGRRVRSAKACGGPGEVQ
jgi:soluble lytic murein transglycosylase-like protein